MTFVEQGALARSPGVRRSNRNKKEREKDGKAVEKEGKCDKVLSTKKKRGGQGKRYAYAPVDIHIHRYVCRGARQTHGRGKQWVPEEALDRKNITRNHTRPSLETKTPPR